MENAKYDQFKITVEKLEKVQSMKNVFKESKLYFDCMEEKTANERALSINEKSVLFLQTHHKTQEDDIEEEEQKAKVSVGWSVGWSHFCFLYANGLYCPCLTARDSAAVYVRPCFFLY